MHPCLGTSTQAWRVDLLPSIPVTWQVETLSQSQLGCQAILSSPAQPSPLSTCLAPPGSSSFTLPFQLFHLPNHSPPLSTSFICFLSFDLFSHFSFSVSTHFPLLPPFFSFLFFSPSPCPSLGTLDMTNLAYDPDALDLEDEEAEGLENHRSPKTSVSSVTTPPSNVKRIPFFKKVKEPGSGHAPCWGSAPACCTCAPPCL